MKQRRNQQQSFTTGTRTSPHPHHSHHPSLQPRVLSTKWIKLWQRRISKARKAPRSAGDADSHLTTEEEASVPQNRKYATSVASKVTSLQCAKSRDPRQSLTISLEKLQTTPNPLILSCQGQQYPSLSVPSRIFGWRGETEATGEES